jgi:Aromatic-ring-opening dioxygenase LigAB, LigA subunit
MGAYEIDLFNHNLSVDPEFRAGILAGDEHAWSSVDLTPDERAALENVDVAWLYARGANDFLLHNLFRFGVGGVTIEHYVRGIKAHLTPPPTPRLTGPQPG